MTLEQEFRNQWTNVCNYIKADILKSNQKNIDLNRIQSILDNEKIKWFLPGQYNNAWFEKLKRTNPDVALKFERTLNDIKFELVDSKKNNSKLVFLGTTAAGAAVGFGVSRIFTAMALQSVLLTVGGTVVGLIVGNIISSKKKDNEFNELYSAYEEQLKKAGEQLSKIISQEN